MNKPKYKHGFYGGKFLPFHRGHKFCINVAASMCEHLTVVMFVNSSDELQVAQTTTVIDKAELFLNTRVKTVREWVRKIPNADVVFLDCQKIYSTLSWLDTWDAETPFVEACIPDMDVVFSSEPGYDEYFKRAYPYAEHILIDPPRVNVPISATAIRAMSTSEGLKWR